MYLQMEILVDKYLFSLSLTVRKLSCGCRSCRSENGIRYQVFQFWVCFKWFSLLSGVESYPSHSFINVGINWLVRNRESSTHPDLSKFLTLPVDLTEGVS